MRAAPLLLVDPGGVDVPGAGPDWILRRAEDGISAAQLWCPRCLGLALLRMFCQEEKGAR